MFFRLTTYPTLSDTFFVALLHFDPLADQTGYKFSLIVHSASPPAHILKLA
jgi:hypothetical protein